MLAQGPGRGGSKRTHRSCAVVLAKRSMRQGPPRMPPPSASGTATRIHHADRSTTTPSTEESSARHHAPVAIRQQQAAGSQAPMPHPLAAQLRMSGRRARPSAVCAGRSARGPTAVCMRPAGGMRGVLRRWGMGRTALPARDEHDVARRERVLRQARIPAVRTEAHNRVSEQGAGRLSVQVEQRQPSRLARRQTGRDWMPRPLLPPRFAPAWSALPEAVRPHSNSRSRRLLDVWHITGPPQELSRGAVGRRRRARPAHALHAWRGAAPSGARAATRACAPRRRPTPSAAPPPAPPRTRRGARPAARAARSGAPRARARAAPCPRPRCRPRCRSARHRQGSAVHAATREASGSSIIDGRRH
jgi:hypothetical protein